MTRLEACTIQLYHMATNVQGYRSVGLLRKLKREFFLSVMAWNGMEWHGMAWNAMNWHRMESKCSSFFPSIVLPMFKVFPPMFSDV